MPDDDWDTIVRKAVRSIRGTHQGCVVGTFGAVVPYHLSLHKTNKACKSMRIVCDADDTITGGPRDSLYSDLEVLRANQLTDCDLRENDAKLAALCPSGGVDGIPSAIVEAQGGESSTVSRSSVPSLGRTRGRGYKPVAMLSRRRLQRLSPLDYTETLRWVLSRH